MEIAVVEVVVQTIEKINIDFKIKETKIIITTITISIDILIHQIREEMTVEVDPEVQKEDKAPNQKIIIVNNNTINTTINIKTKDSVEDLAKITTTILIMEVAKDMEEVLIIMAIIIMEINIENKMEKLRRSF